MTLINKYKNLSVVAKASIWAFIANIIQRGASVIATPIFTRLLTTTEYAQYTLYQSWHDIFIIFTTLNVFNYATYTAMKKYENDRDSFISTAQTLVTGLTIFFLITYYIINIFFKDIIGFSFPIVMIMFFDMLFFASFNLWCSKERYLFKYKTMTFLSVLLGIMGPILGILLIHYCPEKGLARIYGVAVTNILIGLVIYIYNLSKSKYVFKKEYIKFIFAYCIPLIPHFLASQILIRFDRIMIGNMCSQSQAGIYSLAYSLSTLLIIVNDAVLKSYTPWTYQTIKKGKRLNQLKKNTNLLIILVAVANLLLILFAPEAVYIFATRDYTEAIYIIPPVSASIYFMFLFNVYANIEYYYSETKYVGIASILAAIINVVLNYIFIKRYGYLAAGYTTLISYIIYTFSHYIFMKKVEKKHDINKPFFDNRIIMLISIIFTILCLLIIPLYKYMYIRYVIIFIVIVAIIINRKKIIKVIKNI